jgi:hypothetical protein
VFACVFVFSFVFVVFSVLFSRVRPPLEWSLPSPFIDARGAQGYKMCYVMIFMKEKIYRLRSCPVVGGVPQLEEWPLSFDAVATCLDMCSPADGATTTCRGMIITVATCPVLAV